MVCFGTARVSNLLKFSPICESFLPWSFPLCGICMYDHTYIHCSNQAAEACKAQVTNAGHSAQTYFNEGYLPGNGVITWLHQSLQHTHLLHHTVVSVAHEIIILWEPTLSWVQSLNVYIFLDSCSCVHCHVKSVKGYVTSCQWQGRKSDAFTLSLQCMCWRHKSKPTLWPPEISQW